VKRLFPYFLIILFTACAPPSYRGAPSSKPSTRVIPTPVQDSFLYQEGKHAFENEDFTKALDKLDRFVKENPNTELTDDALFLIGQIFMKRENPYEALRYFEKIEKRFPGTNTFLNALYAEAYCWYRLKNYERSRAKLDHLFSFPLPNSLFVRGKTLLGHLFMIGKAYRQALDAYRAAKSKSENATERAILDDFIAKAVFRLESIEQLKKIIEESPESLAAKAARIRGAELLIQNKRFKEAQSLLASLSLQHLPSLLRQKALMVADRLKHAFLRKISIGCLLPLSGKRAPFGIRALKGALLASEAFQDRPKDLDITLLIRDTKGNPENAALMAKDLIENYHVTAIIGPMFRDTTKAVVERISTDSPIPLISLSQADGIPQFGDHVFRNCLTPRQQIHSLVNYLIRKLTTRRAAILYPDTSFGRRYMKLFWNVFIQKGGEIRGAESYAPTDTDFGTPIKKLVGLYYTRERWERGDIPSDKEGKFDPVIDFEVLFIPDIYSRIVLITPQLAFHDILGVTLAGTNTWNSPQLIKEGRRFVRGAIFPDGFLPTNPAPYVRTFVSNFQALYDETPEILAAQAYDSIAFLIHLYRHFPLLDTRELEEKMHEDTGYHGVSGLRYYDNEGEAIRDVLMLTVTRSGIALLPPLSSDEPSDTSPAATSAP